MFHSTFNWLSNKTEQTDMAYTVRIQGKHMFLKVLNKTITDAHFMRKYNFCLSTSIFHVKFNVLLAVSL